MNQFRIKGIDYPDDSLEHGLGKGSGRGRPVGSKNGQVMPGAAYMKGYKITGHKAEELPVGDPRLVQLKSHDQVKKIASKDARLRPTIRRATEAEARAVRQATLEKRKRAMASVKAQSPTSTPAANVAKGKNAVDAMLAVGGTNSQAAGRPADPRGQARPLEGFPQRKMSDSNGKPIVGKDVRQQNSAQNGNVLDQAGRWVSNAANDVGRAVTDAANSAGQWIGNAANDVGNFVGNTAQNVGRAVNNAANAAGQWVGDRANDVDTWLNGTREVRNVLPNGERIYGDQRNGGFLNNAGRDISNAANAAGQWIGDRAGDVSRAASNLVNGSNESPEQKSIWDSIGGWFAQAGKDIGDAVVGAWNTASGAVNDAANWVGDRLKDAGDWATTAISDVGQWVGDRAGEFDTWLNGTREVLNVLPNGERIYGDRRNGGFLNNAGRDISNAANAAGQWIGNAANDVGRFVGNTAQDVGNWVGDRANDADTWLNGTREVLNVLPNGERIYGDRRNGGFLNNTSQAIGNAANAAGQWLDNNVVVPVGREVGDQAHKFDRWWNGYDYNGATVIDAPTGRVIEQYEAGHAPGVRENIGNALNNVGQWVRNAPGNVGNWVSDRASDADTWLNGTREVRNVLPNGERIYGDQRNGGFLNNTGRAISNAANAAGQWLNENVVAPVTSAAGTTGDLIRSGAETVGNAVQSGAQAVGDAAQTGWNAARDFAVNTANNVGNAVNDAIDDYNVRGLARQSAAYQNAPAESRAQVEQDYTDRYKSARNSNVYQSALAAGVPSGEVNRILSDYAGGNVNSAEFVDELSRLANLYANVYNR